mmetsp:Transcript_7946/g.10483  ORF Transcript_7946/g.10483 Transcript_7946/m.10483 type:complete len:253 (+) Transcript_7946:102-860(+)
MIFLACLIAFLAGGLCVAIFLVMSHRLPEKEDYENIVHIYLNGLVQNPNEALKKVVAEEIEKKVLQETNKFRNLLKKFRRTNSTGTEHFVGEAAGIVASKTITEELFSRQLGTKLAEMIPHKMAVMGIEASASLLFVYGTYFVVIIRLIDIDLSVMIEKKSGKQKSNLYRKVMGVLGEKAEDKLNHVVIEKIGEELKAKMPQMMEEQMDEKGIHVNIEVKGKEKQADYHFETLESIIKNKKKHAHHLASPFS